MHPAVRLSEDQQGDGIYTYSAFQIRNPVSSQKTGHELRIRFTKGELVLNLDLTPRGQDVLMGLWVIFSISLILCFVSSICKLPTKGGIYF